MVRKKPDKWFEDENIQRITVNGKNIYIGKKKKEKANLVILIEKNQKTRNWLVKRKKNIIMAAKLQCKKCSILSRAK